MSLDTWKTAAETIESFTKSAGIIAAGIWGYWKLFMHAEHESSISSTLQTRVLASSSDHLRMIEVRTILTNHGKVPSQLDLSRSKLIISSVIVEEGDVELSWSRKPYFSMPVAASKYPLNIPVGAQQHEVQFVVVPHPGVYHIRTTYALTEKAARKFFRRIGLPCPENLGDHIPSWVNEMIVSTESPSDIIVENDEKDSADGI
jgi:hypothetical protein